MNIRLLFLSMLLSLSLLAKAQEADVPFRNLGGRVGIQFTIGQPVKRLGLVFNAYYQRDWAQLNVAWQGYRNFSNYGPPSKSWEYRASISLIAAVGKKAERPNPFIDLLFHQTGRSYAAGYAYHFYKDNNSTSQGAGSIVLHLNDFYILTENDAFGSTVGKDRFRTGAFAIGYHYRDWLYEIKTVMWTGQTRGEKTKTYYCDEQAVDYPARWGYRDISEALYGKYSHGVLALRAQYLLPYGQIAQVGIGIDDEHIRHFVQNKVMHDMYFFPAKWTTVRNLHFPMVDCEGNAYCFKEAQRIRPARLFYELSLNGSRFY